jgi:hypothetical protein
MPLMVDSGSKDDRLAKSPEKSGEYARPIFTTQINHVQFEMPVDDPPDCLHFSLERCRRELTGASLEGDREALSGRGTPYLSIPITASNWSPKIK